jgi:phosphoribosylglycinamide formyltransferase 1
MQVEKTKQISELNKAIRVAILISGRGSNMQNIASYFKPSKRLEIACILSNKASAEGVIWAQQQGLATHVIEHQKYPDRNSFDQAMIKYLAPLKLDYIILAGFMRILTPEFISYFAGKIINIHPSLLPSFTGLNTHQRALDEGVKIHGATVHFVVPELDAGPIIAQAGLAVIKQHATANDLATAVLKLEHQLYPRVLEWLINEDLSIKITQKIDQETNAAEKYQNQTQNQYPLNFLPEYLRQTSDKKYTNIKIIHKKGEPQFFGLGLLNL